MQILAHRGDWGNHNEMNSFAALERALSKGYGIETDLRDFCGELVVAHDPPLVNNDTLARLMTTKKFQENDSYLAINVKSDGLYDKVSSLKKCLQGNKYFCFDMSIPETLRYISAGLNVFTRMSEFEKEPVFLDITHGVWLDAFKSDWYPLSIIEDLIKLSKFVAVVSPELHGRDHASLWSKLNTLTVEQKQNLLICTDFPHEAMEYFDV